MNTELLRQPQVRAPLLGFCHDHSLPMSFGACPMHSPMQEFYSESCLHVSEGFGTARQRKRYMYRSVGWRWHAVKHVDREEGGGPAI